MDKVTKSEQEWKSILTDAEYRVLREKGTERAFTGEYWDCHQDGVYHCRACHAPLFDANSKFDSGCGWPSFSDVMDNDALAKSIDHDLGYPRVEISCARCGGHMGHVFEDGPAPTGLRYCINSVSIVLKKG